MSETTVPPVYNGKPTQYRLFDGFSQASGFGKTVYIVGFFISGPIIPAIFEVAAYFNIQANAKQAAWELSKSELQRKNEPSRSPARAIDMSPDLGAGTKFQEQVQQSKVSQAPTAPIH